MVIWSFSNSSFILRLYQECQIVKYYIFRLTNQTLLLAMKDSWGNMRTVGHASCASTATNGTQQLGWKLKF